MLKSITHLLAVTELKYNPMFDNVRNEPEFQEILTSIETKYQKIHDEVAAIVRKYTLSFTLEGRTTKFKVNKKFKPR